MFGTSVRVALDSSQPLNRRVTNLSNAIEKFPVFGFAGTFQQLHRATGSTQDNWTPEQVGQAARLLADAHDSWARHASDAKRDAHRRKRQPAYRPLRINEVFSSWRDSYFDDERSAAWKLEGAPTGSDDGDDRRLWTEVQWRTFNGTLIALGAALAIVSGVVLVVGPSYWAAIGLVGGVLSLAIGLTLWRRRSRRDRRGAA